LNGLPLRSKLRVTLRNETKNSDPRIQEKMETTMKIKTAVKTSALIAALGFAALLPTQVQAQAEVAPDQFPFSNVVPIAARTAPAVATEAKADFAGKCSLPYGVERSGKNLKPGHYALSVKSEGASRVVTISGTDASVNMQARLVPANRATRRSALLVRKSNAGRKLEGVYVEALNATLYVENGKSFGVMERLPLSE